jgi:purine-binding chemotaxis protein CheW
MADLLENSAAGDEDDMRGRFLTFMIGEETFGIRLQFVMEITNIRPITEIPRCRII